MASIFDKICEHVQNHTNYKVTFGNDENLDGEDRNETRGVLRVNTTDRGVDHDAITENWSMFIDFSVKLDEEESFIETMTKYIKEWQSISMDLEDGHIYKIYFQTLQPINYVQRISGVKFASYILQFTLNLYDNAMFSDDVLIEINGHVLQGVMQYSEASKFERDSHILNTTNIPVAVGCTKIRTYNLVYMPVIGNKASEALFQIHNDLIEDVVSLHVVFPYREDDETLTPVINRTADVSLTDFAVSLQKSTFGQVTCSFNEYYTG